MILYVGVQSYIDKREFSASWRPVIVFKDEKSAISWMYADENNRNYYPCNYKE